MKRGKLILYFGFVSILFVLIGFSSCSGCVPEKRIDWRPTFRYDHTIPYGTYITYNLLDSVFDNAKITMSDDEIWEVVYDRVGDCDGVEDEDTGQTYFEPKDNTDEALFKFYKKIKSDTILSYIFIQQKYYVSNSEISDLCNFVGRGNNVFVSAEYIDEDLLAKLNLRLKSQDSFYIDTTYVLENNKQNSYDIGVVGNYTYFDINKNSKLPTRVLATSKEDDNPVFIEVKYGLGYFYVSATPAAFTNLNMLDTKKYDFGLRCLSYLPNSGEIIWDEWMTSEKTRSDKDEDDSSSMFRVIFSDEAMTFAFWIIIVGLLLFMLFKSKRIQRIIPVWEKPSNTTLAFLETLSTMYYRKKAYGPNIEKRHAYLLDYIRNNFYLSTENIDENFIKQLSAKSGVSTYILKDLFNYYEDVKRFGETTQDIYIDYNKLLEQFYNTAKK